MKLLPVMPALRSRLALSMVACLVLAVAPIAAAQQQAKPAENESTEAIYQRFCASCHGKDLTGAGAQSMVDGVWQFGSGNGSLFRNIKFGITSRGMPEYQHALSDRQINDLVGFIMKAQDRADVEPPPLPEKLETRHYDVGVAKWIDGGLQAPWALVFIDDHRAIISERPGRLRMVTDGKLNPEPVRGTPNCLPEGQGGYMDVALDPDYANNGWVYLSYSDPWTNDQGKVLSMTRVARGKIVDNEWTESQDVYRAANEAYSDTRHHYGSRIAFDHEGRMLLGVGERGAQDLAQDLQRPNGKIHRVWPDGRIPDDNPYADGKQGLKTVYSYGHRNPQGLAVHPETGEIWETEHGPMGGDEVNLVLKGENYGWPLASYGINYDGNIITENMTLEGTRQPVSYWVPSIAVCGTRFCVGDEFPRWQHNLLVGGLAYEELRRLVVAQGRVLHQEVLLKNAGRVRDVACDPSGAVYVVLNNPDIVLKLTNLGRALRQ
ncbi:Soluble aldose sugar dehydrogenase YliI precursor [Posidoniimonas polymericola]|uniref:Soluble aldose sugar dehydrogenase YliI n=1 Tax=Posidoniimonas polymericola TaxID=2528002 RepID=A0A5C5YTD9_9BACT|nr:PQQ-dependent sugar dehydrogenase [Posidoniimonas polymericola]TWT77917.1 Soluble aldose sugar dehydrogenase YliI precursor [Posidoniimonas polymericola]